MNQRDSSRREGNQLYLTDDFAGVADEVVALRAMSMKVVIDNG